MVNIQHWIQVIFAQSLNAQSPFDASFGALKRFIFIDYRFLEC